MILKNKKIYYGLGLFFLALLIFTVGFVVGANQVVCKAYKPEQIDFSLFWDAYNKLSEKFIDPSKINNQDIIYGAIAGMTKSLQDPYTTFFDPKEAKIFQEDLSGSFDGIGAEIGIKKDQLTIIAPLPDSPAQRAGIKAGDQIIEIDGKSAFDMSIEEAVSLIRGKKGTKVVLTIFRDGWKQAQDITVSRDTIKIKSVEWKLVASLSEADGEENDIAYLKVYNFDEALIYDFNKIAYKILDSGAKGIILDLRNNPGGFLEVSLDFAGWFLKSGQVITIEDFGEKKEKKEYKANGNGIFANYQTVILIDGGTASASEILAGALKDNRGVKLIGEKSFGKGSVQELTELQDKSSFLKITIAKWLTPKGTSISEVGLNPDFKIETTQKDLDGNNDPQLQKALEIIKDLH